MLLEFRLENFKSFEDPTVFSMVPTPKQTDLEYSLLKKKITGIRKEQRDLGCLQRNYLKYFISILHF